MDAKALLRSALQKAHVAVLADQEKNNAAALEAYTEALLLLDQVLISVDRDEDKMRIQQIYETYSDRIRSLHLLSPKPDSQDLYHTFEDTPSSKPIEQDDDQQSPLDWLSRPANRKFSNRSLRSPSTPQIYQRAPSPSPETARPRKQPSARSLHSPDDSPTPTYSKSTPSTRQVVKPEEAFSPLPPPRRKPSTARARSPSPSPMRPMRSFSPSHHHPLPLNALHLITQPSLPPPTAPLPSIPVSQSEPLGLKDHDIVEEEDIVLPASKARSISSCSSIDSLQVSTTPSSHQSTPVLEKENIHMNPEPIQHTPLPTPPQQQPTSPVAPSSQELKPNRIIPPQRKVSLQNTAMIHSASLPIPQKNPEDTSSKLPSSPPVLQRTSSVQTFPNMFGRPSNSVLIRKGSIPTRTSSQMSRPSPGEKAPMSEYFGKQPSSNGSPNQKMNQLVDTHALPEPVNLPVPGTPLHLFKALESSMIQGAYISRRLYVPKKLWHQSNVRLPSIESKLNAIETLLPPLAKLELWSHLTDVPASMRQIDALAKLLDSLQTSLAKKLGQLKKGHDYDEFQTNSMPRKVERDSVIVGLKDSGPGGRKQFSSWGSRLSKSMTFTSAKSEDLYQQYIDSLLKLFQASHVLEAWLVHYKNAKTESTTSEAQCENMLQKLRKVCESLDTVIGGFVVRDLAILLGKWMKRGSSWVGD
ncbi:hypothetical protein INT44_009223 [Umbelopsis vinacea]|uniref:MIT domain-containing protein n=1 Tax=Umbelopsis vinacea TaxID=44442 RepID=A0A8H7ULJ3_9FUNG|nr:hypothetical protein INT44_009223 [Umbelopsis vinacea]